MTRATATLALIVLLAACGADGPPVPPSQATPSTTQQGANITITGDARFGYEGNL
jgi:predicted small lipoprotein YifL